MAFDFQTSPLTSHAVGQTAQLDFDSQSQHHSCESLIVHAQDRRVLLSLRGASAAVLAALQSVNRDNMPSLSNRLSTLQAQQACHSRFMDGMKAVVDDFYLLLPEQIQNSANSQTGPNPLPAFTRLQNALNALRPELTRKFTQAYPMYPELIARQPDALPVGPTDPDDMGRVDDWIRRTTIAQRVNEATSPLPEKFNRHYSSLLKSTCKQVTHPYQTDVVLNILAELIAPLKPDPNERALCYEVMGHAFQNHALTLYQDLLGIVGEVPTESDHLRIANLEQWLSLSASGAPAGEGGAAAVPINELAALLGRLTDNLGELNERMPVPAFPRSEADFSAARLIPGLLARDRIFERFLPASTEPAAAGLPPDNLAFLEPGAPAASAVRQALGGLTDLDSAALQGLYALMRQQPVVESGPEKLAQASQVRVLMLQAQGLLLEYTLNGLTYQSQPDHPAWRLVNALDALHQGADNRGQFLDPALHQAVSLSMQWLLGQDDVDIALAQVNHLLEKINAQLHADRQSRRTMHLLKLGAGCRPQPHPFGLVHRPTGRRGDSL